MRGEKKKVWVGSDLVVYSGLRAGFQRLAPEDQPYGAWKPAEAPVAKPKPRCGRNSDRVPLVRA